MWWFLLETPPAWQQWIYISTLRQVPVQNILINIHSYLLFTDCMHLLFIEQIFQFLHHGTTQVRFLMAPVWFASPKYSGIEKYWESNEYHAQLSSKPEAKNNGILLLHRSIFHSHHMRRLALLSKLFNLDTVYWRTFSSHDDTMRTLLMRYVLTWG